MLKISTVLKTHFFQNHAISNFRGLQLTKRKLKQTSFSLNCFDKRFKMEDVLMPMRMAVKEQGDVVRKLKEEKSDVMTIKAAVQELKKRKKAMEDKELELQAASGPKFDRELFEKSCKQRFIYGASFDIYERVLEFDKMVWV